MRQSLTIQGGVVDDWRRRERSSLGAQYSEIKTQSAPSFLAVLPVVLLQQFALGLGRGVLPVLFTQQLGGTAAALDSAAMLLKGLFAVASCPLMGALSDRWGRRPLRSRRPVPQRPRTVRRTF